VAARRAAEALVAVVRGHPRAARWGRVALFASLPDEIGTRPLFEAFRSAGCECVFPRCVAGDSLVFARVDDWPELSPGSWGTLEPLEAAAGELLSGCDAVFVPGLAFDRSGARLGRGRGFYDRALAKLAGDVPFRCGLSYAFQVVDRVPTGPLDVRVDAVACESGWHDVVGDWGESSG